MVAQEKGERNCGLTTAKDNVPDAIPRPQELHHRASQQALRSEERLSGLKGDA